jgi:hypothetical protein
MRVGVLAALLVCVSARADPPCRSVEITFQPVDGLQIAVWIEDAQGRYVDTAYVTRLTGALGLANRPGEALLKTDVRFPYGRREMVLPVWAHRRNHPYGRVVMGGHAGNSITTCGSNGIAGTECDDATIGYHFDVSSNEPFFCSPRGGLASQMSGVDVVTCASSFYGSKGAYADLPAFSLYPPRADLTSFVADHDSSDATRYSLDNDLVAVSGATPAGGATLDPPIRWRPPADGAYVLWVEQSQESDFNAYHNHPQTPDEHPELDGYGHAFLGQPSLVYAVPFTVSDQADVEVIRDYLGYGDWDGATGTLNPPDFTITTDDGSGAGRLLTTTDEDGIYRVKVRALPSCTPGPTECAPPLAPTGLALVPHASSVDVAFASAPSGPPVSRFDLRYRESSPISDADFAIAIPSSSMPPPPGNAGDTVHTSVTGLRPLTSYTLAVRAVAMCGAPSPIATAQTITGPPEFATLHGCFVATAAYGSPLASELDRLRRFRDRVLLESAAGRLAVAAYYAFSPPLARALVTVEPARSAVRALLAPIVRALR